MSDFHFMFYVLHLTLRTSSKFLKILHNSDVYRLSLTLHCLLSKLKRPLNGNANNSENLLNGVFGMCLFFGILKNTCLLVYVRIIISLILQRKTFQHIVLKSLKLLVLIMPFCSLTLQEQSFADILQNRCSSA